MKFVWVWWILVVCGNELMFVVGRSGKFNYVFCLIICFVNGDLCWFVFFGKFVKCFVILGWWIFFEVVCVFVVVWFVFNVVCIEVLLLFKVCFNIFNFFIFCSVKDN